MQLLVISLSQIYHKVEEAHPQIIVLKLFMLLAVEQTAAKMVGQTNIQHYCIQKISANGSDCKITKAYIDFLVEMYPNDPKVQ
jgi:CTP-dependent riboflavin kinase